MANSLITNLSIKIITARKPDFQGFYKTASDTPLPIWIYFGENDKADDKPPKSAPLFLMIHGGSWQAIHMGERHWNGGFLNFQAQYYAIKGYTSAVISYRSIDFEETTVMDDLIADCADAVSFLLKRCPKRKIVLIGDSAGAHLALELALRNFSHICAIVAANPVLDCTLERWHFTAHTLSQRQELSPIYQIRKITPPILCMQGSLDNVVDPGQAEEFCRRMQETGNRCDLYLLPDAMHAFLLFNYRSSAQQVLQYMTLIDKWLKDSLPC